MSIFNRQLNRTLHDITTLISMKTNGVQKARYLVVRLDPKLDEKLIFMRRHGLITSVWVRRLIEVHAQKVIEGMKVAAND